MKTLLTLITALVVLQVPALAEGTRVGGKAEIIIPGEKSESVAYNRWHYAPAVKVGNVVYASGVAVAAPDGDMEAAMHRAWQRIDALLKEAGGSLDDIVEFTSYHIDADGQLEAFARIKDEYIKEPYPAWTLIGVKNLALPELILEIKVTAVLSE